MNPMIDEPGNRASCIDQPTRHAGSSLERYS
jgi:hypothetical protein